MRCKSACPPCLVRSLRTLSIHSVYLHAFLLYSWMYAHSVVVCVLEVACCTCQVEIRRGGVWCDIYVGVIVWSVKTFHNHTHSLPCGAVEARLCVNYNMCEMLLHVVPHLKHEAKDNFDWIPLFVFCILSWEAENACLWKVHWSLCMRAVKLAAVLTFETGWSGPLRPTPLPTVRPMCTLFFFLKH